MLGGGPHPRQVVNSSQLSVQGDLRMKLLYAMLTCVALVAAVLLSPGQASQETNVTWSANLATITWAEPLADAKAGADESPFAILSGPSLGWLTPTEAVISWEV